MLDFFKKNAHYLILLFGGLFLIGLPIYNQFSSVDWNWQGVPLDVPNYYYARLREILDGHPFMGNPYFWEHRNEIAPAFFLADWLVVVPVLLGFSLGMGSIINLIIWTALCIWLCYYFLRQVGVPKNESSIGAIIITISVYSYLIIPVSMQVIYPVFIFFLIALWQWFKKPLETQTQILLSIATVLNFYIYTYLWQIALVWLGLFFLYFLGTKQYLTAKRLCVVGVSSVLMALPLFFYTWKQISHPFYWDSMERIGLVYTHLPTAVVLYSGFWITLVTFLWLSLYWWIQQVRENNNYKKAGIFFGLFGGAVCITSISNVFMGKELETAQHIDRFTKIWFGTSCIVWVVFCKEYFSQLLCIGIVRKLLVLVAVLLTVIGGSMYYVGDELSYLTVVPKRNENAVQSQKIIESLHWLEKNESEPSVVWSNSEKVNSLLPITTKHYVLFANYGILHLLSSAEVEDRYLVSQYFANLTTADLKKNLRQYAGSARAIHNANTNNRWVILCRSLRLEEINIVSNCGQLTTAVDMMGEQYFDTLLTQYYNNSQKIIEKLAQYHVQYLVKDMSGDQNFAPEKIPGTRLVYEDAQLKIYQLKQ